MKKKPLFPNQWRPYTVTTTQQVMLLLLLLLLLQQQPPQIIKVMMIFLSWMHTRSLCLQISGQNLIYLTTPMSHPSLNLFTSVLCTMYNFGTRMSCSCRNVRVFSNGENLSVPHGTSKFYPASTLYV